MKGNSSPRSHGTKLLEPKSNQASVESPVTTRMYDIAHYERTGELKYLDEEGTTMKLISAVEKTKIMRSEITRIEQFEAIGNTSDVSKKYDVSKVTVQGLKTSLQAKKAREEADKVLEAQKGPSTEEAEQVYLETEVHELAEVEIDETVKVEMDQSETSISTEKHEENGREPEDDIKDNWPIVNEWKGIAEMEAIAAELDSAELMIETLWRGVESDMDLIRKLYIKRAEEEFKAHKTRVMAC